MHTLQLTFGSRDLVNQPPVTPLFIQVIAVQREISNIFVNMKMHAVQDFAVMAKALIDTVLEDVSYEALLGVTFDVMLQSVGYYNVRVVFTK